MRAWLEWTDDSWQGCLCTNAARTVRRGPASDATRRAWPSACCACAGGCPPVSPPHPPSEPPPSPSPPPSCCSCHLPSPGRERAGLGSRGACNRMRPAGGRVPAACGAAGRGAGRRRRRRRRAGRGGRGGTGCGERAVGRAVGGGGCRASRGGGGGGVAARTDCGACAPKPCD